MRRATFLAIAWAAVALGVLEVATDLVGHAVSQGRERADLTALDAGTSATTEVWVDLLDLPIFAIVALWLARRLSETTSKPLRDLTAATRTLAGSRFGTVVPVPPGDAELAELARSFNSMQSALEEAFERERAFARYAAHELRTPLAAMRVQVERATLGLAPSSEILPSLERHIVRTTELLDALASFGLAGDGPDEPRRLPELVQEAIDAAHATRGGRATIVGAAPTQRVRHARMVQQVIQNLIDNALTHGTIPVTVRLQVDGNDLTVVVRDEGPGMATSARPRTQATPSEETAGVHPPRRGLGLAMVSSVTRALGGTFEAGRMDDGFEARVELPVVEADAT